MQASKLEDGRIEQQSQSTFIAVGRSIKSKTKLRHLQDEDTSILIILKLFFPQRRGVLEELIFSIAKNLF